MIMMKISVAVIILFFSYNCTFGQSISYRDVKHEFESFEYEKVISLSDELLSTSKLSDTLLVDIHLMRAISFFSIRNENKCKISFGEILKINRNWTPDPSTISPVIIPFFNEAKAEFSKNESPQQEVKDSTLVNFPSKIFNHSLMRESAVRNIFLPGWGQLYSGSKSKGTVITAVSATVLAASIYFIVDTNNKENEYLSTVDKNLIMEKYNDYNSSYKIRNVLLISYAAIWLFSQLDLFFLSEDNTFIIDGSNISPNISFQNSPGVGLNFKIPF